VFNKSKQLSFTKHYEKNLENLFTYQLTLGPLTDEIVGLPSVAFDSTIAQLDKMAGWYGTPVLPPKLDYFVVFDAFWNAAKRAKHPERGLLWENFVLTCVKDLDEKITNYCKPIQERYLECVQADFSSSLDWDNYLDLLGEGVWLDNNPLLGIKYDTDWSKWNPTRNRDLPRPIAFLTQYQEHAWTNRRKLKIFLQYGNEPNKIFEILEED
jgi:hypothetical protein